MRTARRELRRRAVLAVAAGVAVAAMVTAPASADRTWDRGGGDNFWTTPANWNPDGLPSSADNVTFTDTGAGTVDLNGTTQPASGSFPSLTFNNATTGYTVQNGTINLGSLNHSAGATVVNTVSAQLVATGAINVSSGTLVLSNGNNTISGPVAVAAGAKLDVMAPSSKSIGSVSLNGGTLVVRGGVTTTNNALQELRYQNLSSPTALNPIGTTLARTPSSTAVLQSPLSFNQAALDAKAGQGDQYTIAWRGNMTVSTAGDYSFGTLSDDGSIVYVDKNKDGTFDPATEIVVNNNFDQGANTPATGTVTLAAGTYPVAIGFYENAGGSSMEARVFAGTGVAYASQTVLDPTAPISGLSFSYDVFNPADLSAGSITVTANSVLDIQSTTGAIGNVSFNTGTSLTVQGLIGAVVTTGNLSGNGTATLNTSIPTTAGSLSGFTTFTKGGTSSLTLNTPSAGFAGQVVVGAGN